MPSAGRRMYYPLLPASGVNALSLHIIPFVHQLKTEHQMSLSMKQKSVIVVAM
jgi:hypothetical protein